ncbi:MAG: DUF4388 domain-containing protein [Thermoanaerobaculia bacterium]|nr:DUF4388 domain-containing protein [Thermoanaerobaculia bacterium]
MIPNNDQLAAIAKLRGGDLAQYPFGIVLYALAAHGRSVLLEIERKPMKKGIVIENGVPVDCQSNLLHETLARFMVAQGRLEEAEATDFFQKATQQGQKLGEVLILEGKISASELYKVLQQNLARKLLDGFSWRNGTFRVYSEMPEVDSPLKVNAPQLVVTGISKFARDDEVNTAIGPLVGKRLFLHPDPPFGLDEIRLSREQQQLVAVLASGKRLDELAAETSIPFDQIMRLLYSLAVIGIVVPEDWMPKHVPAERPKAKPKARPDEEEAASTTRVADQELQPADIERTSNRLMEAYLKHRSMDAFQLLGLEESATALDVQDAYLKFSQDYAPWQFDVPGLKSLIEKAEDLFLAGGRAFGELCDVERRNELITRRRTLAKKDTKKDVASRFAIESELLDSELQYKKGRAFMHKQRWSEAVKLLQFAYDCDPQNSTYGAELAYSKFMSKPDIYADEAREELKETLRIDPKSGLAAYYLGMLEMDTENFKAAKAPLESALRLLKGDRRPIEALKELQQRAKRRKKKLSFLG